MSEPKAIRRAPDPSGTTRKRVNLMLDPRNIAAAKKLGINMSKVAESAIVAAINRAGKR